MVLSFCTRRFGEYESIHTSTERDLMARYCPAVEFAFLITLRNVIFLMQSSCAQSRTRLRHLSHHFHVLYIHVFVLRSRIAHEDTYLCRSCASHVSRLCRMLLKHFSHLFSNVWNFYSRSFPSRGNYLKNYLNYYGSPIFPLFRSFSPCCHGISFLSRFAPGESRWLCSLAFDFSPRRWVRYPNQSSIEINARRPRTWFRSKVSRGCR